MDVSVRPVSVLILTSKFVSKTTLHGKSSGVLLRRKIVKLVNVAVSASLPNIGLIEFARVPTATDSKQW